MMHLRNKYIAKDSPVFCKGMSKAERNMCYKQEMALYFGGNVTLGDPYALAKHGGLLNVFDMEKVARKAAEEYVLSKREGE